MPTYIIQAESGGEIKIGNTLGDPQKRRKNLQTGNPSKLCVIGTVDEPEKILHARFKHLRSAGGTEWFRLEGELKVYLLEKGIVPVFSKPRLEISPSALVDQQGKEEKIPASLSSKLTGDFYDPEDFDVLLARLASEYREQLRSIGVDWSTVQCDHEQRHLRGERSDEVEQASEAENEPTDDDDDDDDCSCDECEDCDCPDCCLERFFLALEQIEGLAGILLDVEDFYYWGIVIICSQGPFGQIVKQVNAIAFEHFWPMDEYGFTIEVISLSATGQYRLEHIAWRSY
jgi:hypothetical protein